LGEFFALLCALFWAVAVILFKRSGETVPPFALNLFRVTISSVLLVITTQVAGSPLVRDVPLQDILILVAGGVLSITFADTFFHKCLNTVGAGITAIVECLYSPLMIMFAFLLLGERVGWSEIGGMSLVIGGVLIASGQTPPEGLSQRRQVEGVLWGVAAMTSLTLGVILVKPVLDHQPILWATAVRQVGALAVMAPFVLISPRRREWLDVFRPKPDWRFTVPGTIIGSYLALIFWLAGLKLTTAGVAAILNQTSTIYVLILATIFLKESFTKRKIAASVMAVGGILLVTLF